MTQERGGAFSAMLGERIRLARKEEGLTQKDLSDRLGFKDRQILANIEAGIRKVTADELLVIMNTLNRTLDYLTDPFLVLGERVFAWRVDRESCVVDEYETRARSVVGAYRHFCEMLEKLSSPIIPTLAIMTKSSYEDAQAAGGQLAKEFELGEVPAKNLADIIEKKLGIHILSVDAPQGVSGAACHLDNMRFILINCNEPAGRRNYDLAHELFHVLTWSALPPEKIEVGFSNKKGPRAEQLADNFAAALLMPEQSLRKSWDTTPTVDITDKINTIAQEFMVSSVALKYRLRNLQLITAGDILQIDESRLKWTDAEPKPLLYSKIFAEMLYKLLDKGRLSVRRAAGLLDCSIDDLKDLFHSYDMNPPFDI